MQGRIIFAVALGVGLFSTAAIAETADERQACMNDAFRVCSATIPDRERTIACMVQNKSQLSAACQSVMNSYGPPANATVAAAKPSLTKPAAMKTAAVTQRPGKPLKITTR